MGDNKRYYIKKKNKNDFNKSYRTSSEDLNKSTRKIMKKYSSRLFYLNISLNRKKDNRNDLG